MSDTPAAPGPDQPGSYSGRFLPNPTAAPDTYSGWGTAADPEVRNGPNEVDLLPAPDPGAAGAAEDTGLVAPDATGPDPLEAAADDAPEPVAAAADAALTAGAPAVTASPADDTEHAAPAAAPPKPLPADPAPTPADGAIGRAPRTAPGLPVEELPTVLANITAGRDVNVARNLSVTNYMNGLAHLLPHRVSRDTLVPAALFEPPPGYESARAHLAPDPAGQRSRHVLALTAEPGTGARSAALALLGDVLAAQHDICELLPDWDTPKIDQVPAGQDTGYLLNLVGAVDALPQSFHEELAGYAAQARATDTVLVVLAPRSVWSAHALPSPLVAHTALGRPDPHRIAARALAPTPARVGWLTEPEGKFADLLTADSSPDDATRLAAVVGKATGPADADALDEYLGWEAKLEQWFGGDDPAAPPQRALRISAAFLDRAPAQVVLDAADDLLALPALHWPAAAGGPLAGPSAKSRCQGAGLAFNADGSVSLTQRHPGIDRALITHLWHTRPQLVAPLTTWLSRISAKDGVAVAHRAQIAQALTTVAEAEGPSAVLGLLERWLAEGNRIELAVNLLDDLAVHPVIGPAVRAQLGNWASGISSPQRQQAVALVCARQLGHTYPRTALTRLGYILDPRTQPVPRAAARQSLAALLEVPDLAAPTLTALTGWIPDPASPLTGAATAFVDLLTVPDQDAPNDEGDRGRALTRIRALLAHSDPVGAAVRTLLARGLRRSWRHTGIRPLTAAAIDSWCTAAEHGELEFATLNEFVTVVLSEEASALGDDLNRIIGGNGTVHTQLRRQYFQALFDRTQPAAQPVHQ